VKPVPPRWRARAAGTPQKKLSPRFPWPMRPAGEHISMTLSSTASSALASASRQLDLAAEGIRKAAAPAWRLTSSI